MRRKLLRAAGLIGGILALGTPGYSKESKMVVYAPDVLGVGRLFMVALKVPTQAPKVAVTVPDCMVMIDRTPVPAKSEVRRFYFRTVKAAKKAEILFEPPSGRVVVPVEIWSYDDLRKYRKLKNVQLPRRWPLGKPLPELKQGQTITTEAVKAALKGSKRGSQWLSVSDEQIWALQPDSTIPRWHWTNIRKGCPVHGTEIYRKRAYYPWIFDNAIPRRWKIKCPIGGEEYPSNDFAHGDMTSGDFPDDGIGGACLYKGERYGFIAETAQHYCRVFMQIAPQCADGYVGTGDIRYAHKALVAMCRLAEEFAYLATMTQHRHRNRRSQVDRLGPGLFREGPCLLCSGFTVYPIELPGHQVNHAEAYDKIWPAIDQDTEIIPLLQSKGYRIKTHQDVRRFIEENLFAVWMQGSMDGACASNEPYSQWGFARMAEMLNYASGTDFMDFLYDTYQFEFTPMRIFVPNTYFRDGAPFESTGGYNGMHVSALRPIVESVEHLRRLRPKLYPETKYPNLTKSRRYRSIFDFSMDTVTIDRTYPQIGDSGSYPAYKKLPRITWQNGGPPAFEHAYLVFRDPKFAWALARSRSWKPSTGFPFTRKQIEQEAAKWPDDWNDASSLHDGYGISILRGGRGTKKRALWMMYGRNREHSHDDIMDIGLDAFEGKLLQHMGYPRQWSSWERNWITHNLARQIPFVQMTATARLFADAGPVHLAEARARGFVDEVDQRSRYRLLSDDWQRRMIALIDVDDDDFYCLDFYRICGGAEQWWSFHAQPGPVKTRGLTLRKQPGGTVAGADVAYGDPKWLKANGCGHGGYGWYGNMYGLAHLYNVERSRPPKGVWSADWTIKNGRGLHLRLTVASTDGAEVILCDGKSPAGGSPYEMKWVLLHRKGKAPVKTQVLSTIEAYRHKRVVRRVRPLKLSGGDEAGFAAMGCTVDLGSRVDTVFAAADGSKTRSAPGGFAFAGRFGLYREKNGVPTAMVLVGGTRLNKGDFGVTLREPEYHGKIIKVDRAAETITVSPGPDDPGELVGKRVFITNPVRRVAYKVLAAKAGGDGAELWLALDSRIGTGMVTGVRDHRVLTSTPFALHHYRYYHGARLVNADRSAEYRIIEVRDKGWALIDAEAHPEAKAARLAQEFPKGSWFEVYDFGPGDEVVYPRAVSVRRVGAAEYEISGPKDAKADLPPKYKCKWVGY